MKDDSFKCSCCDEISDRWGEMLMQWNYHGDVEVLICGQCYQFMAKAGIDCVQTLSRSILEMKMLEEIQILKLIEEMQNEEKATKTKKKRARKLPNKGRDSKKARSARKHK